MRDKAYQFRLNQKMEPIVCIVTAVHLLRDRPRFDIDFNVDTGEGVDETYDTRLQNVEARFLYPMEQPLNTKIYDKLKETA